VKHAPAWILLAAAAAAVSGCTTTSTLGAPSAGTTVVVKTSAGSATPRTDTFQATSFGNFEFRAERPGAEPLYGILPLKFNGGYLAADILFFAPLMFVNLREPYPFYEFDLDKRVVRYRLKSTDGWTMYEPTAAEQARAQRLLGTK